MNNEDKIHINSFKFYDRDELEELTKQYYLENKQLKEKLDCDLKWAFKCDELTKENQKLKKEIEKIIAVADTNSELADKFYNKIQKSKEMQREFIDWLENEKKEQFIQHRICHQSYQLFIEKIIETETMILEKYKEIIGDKDE